MAPSKLRKVIGAVKDKTSIGLAKVSNSSTLSDLDVAIVKATRHNEQPADDKYVREILSLTCYSRAYVGACVASLSRRLGKTRSWTVALKTLILIHRLLSEGDPAYEKEIFFATRQGTRMLNMSDFRDSSRSDAWDFAAFVRTYSLYLDERLDYRMHGRRKRRGSRSNIYDEEEEEEEAAAASSKAATPVRDMRTERIFVRTQHLQQLLERFLACRPTGAAKHDRIVAVALYPLVKESFQIYYDLADIMNVFIDRFMELEVPDCVQVHDVFARLAKQFDELDLFYGWSKSAGICRSSEFPEVEHITAKKLQVMDEFIRDKAALAHAKQRRILEAERDAPEEDKPPEEEPEYNMNSIRALPAPEDDAETTKQKHAIVVEVKNDLEDKKKEEEEEEVDLLNLKGDAMTSEEHGDKLALALFDGNMAGAAPKWEAFASNDSSDWETALVETASNLSGKKASLGGGFDMLLLDGMYAQAQAKAAQGYASNWSASSVVLHAAPTAQPMLALPAPPVGGTSSGGGDPFAASLMVPPPSYVQMSEMERKQQLLTEEQRVWQQYAKNGMQGQLAVPKLHQYPPGAYHPTGGTYARMY